jgi:hypothetical protein
MLELFLDNRSLIQNWGAVTLFASALWKGGGPERLCAGTVFAMVVAELLFHTIAGPDESFQRFDLWHFTLDSLGLVALVTVALQANRFYPLVLASAQLVAFTSHIVRALVEPVSSLSYYLLYNMPFWFQLIVLGLGIIRNRRRSSDGVLYRDWRPHAPSLGPMGYS